MKNHFKFILVCALFVLSGLPVVVQAATTYRIIQGDTVYVSYPMQDSCFIIMTDVKHKTYISDMDDFETPTCDKNWIYSEQLYKAVHQVGGVMPPYTPADDTLILRIRIISDPSPMPGEIASLIVRNGYDVSPNDTFYIVAIPHVPDEKCTSEGQPMHPYRGDQYLMRNDLSLAGRGLNVNITRSYSSEPMESPDPNGSLSWTLPFGTGWTHNYNLFYTLEGGYPYAATNLTIKSRDSRRILHCCKWNNTYSSYETKAGEHNSILIQTVGSDSIWVDKQIDGTIYYYKRLAGFAVRLDSIKDNNGNSLKMTYTGNNLTKITDPKNREINITYSGNLIQRLYQSPNTSAPYMAYEYENVNGRDRLIRVSKHTNTATDTSVLLEKYIYNGSHQLIAIQLASGKYGENTDTTRSRNKGDRMCYWYDAQKRIKYEEVILGDADETLSNDKVVYRAQFRYYNASDSTRDSTVIYYYEDSTYIGSRDPLNDTVPSLPTAKYYRKVYRYNSDGTIAKIMLHNPNTGDTSCTTYSDYDGDLNPRQVIDPNGSLTKYRYAEYRDSVHNWRTLPLPDTIIYPNSDTSFTYYSAKAGNRMFFTPDSSIDELKNRTWHLYDGNGNDTAAIFKSRVLADGDTNHHDVTTRYHYYANGGNFKETLDPLGHKVRMYYAPDSTGTYPAQQRVIMSTDTGSTDIVTKYGYNVNVGTLDTMTFYRDFPNNPSVTYYFNDLFHKPYKILNPDNSYDSLVYDKRGNVIEKYTRRSDTTFYRADYEYDPLDQLTKMKEYRAPKDTPTVFDSTQYRYSLHQKLSILTNQVGKATNYTNVLDRLVKVSYADTTKDSLGYYADGSLKYKIDRKGQVAEYVYDGTSGGCGCPSSSRYRLVTKKHYIDTAHYHDAYGYAHPAARDSFEYDKVGNRIKMIDTLGTTQYAYDGLYRVKYDSCGYLNTKTMYLYDHAGNRTRMKVCTGDTGTVYLDQQYKGYDHANRYDSVTVSGNDYVFDYWDTGTPKSIQYYNDGATRLTEYYYLTNRGFIDSIRTARWIDAPLTTYWFKNKYGYNGLGDRTSQYLYLSRPGTSALSGTITYSYYGLRRLKETVFPAGINSGLTVDYLYDKAGNRLCKTDAMINYFYNNANNQLTKIQDAETQNNLEFFRYDDNGNLACDSVLSGSKYYYYTNDFENRITKVKQSTDSTVFYYDGDGDRMKKDGTKDTALQYIHDGMYAAVERRNNGNLKYKYVYANGMLLARIDSAGTAYFYSHDALGSMNGAYNSEAVYKSFLCDEFGDSLGAWGATNINNYRYTGQEYDSKPMYAYNLRAREYYPKLGRFMQNDPIGDRGGDLNWYSYVANNPINYKDPTGLFTMVYIPNMKTKMMKECDECASAIKYALELYQLVRTTNLSDKYLHCIAFCTIAKKCGSEFSSFSGALREYLQGYKPGETENDLVANEWGIICPANVDCMTHCKHYPK